MRDAETLTMSAKEVDRLEIIGRVVERRLTQRAAAARLGLSLRHVERLCHAFRRHGAAGLVSRKRGRPSNRKLAEAASALRSPTRRVLTRRPDLPSLPEHAPFDGPDSGPGSIAGRRQPDISTLHRNRHF